jgi:flagellar protein FlbD
MDRKNMIVVTRLNASRFAINPDLIERIHANPDTTLVMVDGAKYIVTESMDEVIDLIAGYRARVIALAYERPTPVSGPHLGLVTAVDAGPRSATAGGGAVHLRPRNI